MTTFTGTSSITASVCGSGGEGPANYTPGAAGEGCGAFKAGSCQVVCL